MSLSVSLRHRFGDFALDVDFDAPLGVTVLYGASGCGKSTVINAVAGLMRPDFGHITAGGRVLCDTDRGVHIPPHRRRIAVVFQDIRLFGHLSVRQNLCYGRWFAPRGGAQLSEIVDLLDIAPLLARAPVTLSGGEAQRVALGRALLSNPHMLLMDEPLAALDSARRAEILPYIERLRDHARLPILYVTHAMPEVTRLASTLVVMGAGRVLHAGAASALLAEGAVLRSMGQGALICTLHARVLGDAGQGLMRLTTAGGEMFVPAMAAAAGAAVHLRIKASDVMLSRARPEGLSAQNILACRVQDVQPFDDASVLVGLACGADLLLAQITHRAAEQLALNAGQEVFAIVKTAALGRV
jgi:molybdate transport system ATP-binding protein